MKRFANFFTCFIFIVFYTTTASVSGQGGPVTNPSPDIQANSSNGPLTLGASDTLNVTVSMDAGGGTGSADWWVYATITSVGTFWYTLEPASSWVLSATPVRTFGGPLFDLTTLNVLSLAGLPIGDYVFNFSVDANMDGAKDDTFKDSVSVTVKTDAVSFKNDIAPLFNSTSGNGAWFNYGNGGDTFGPDRACGTCHAGDDGVEPEQCPPECHLMDLNTHAGWLAGADGGTAPLLGEGTVGNTTYDWSKAKLRKRLRDNRMPPGIPFNIDELNRNGGSVDTSDDGNDIALGGQFFVNVAGTDGRGEVEYGGTDSAIGLLSAYVDGLNGTPATYAGSANPVVFADIAGLFSRPNVWYNGGLACTSCHYCAEEPPCFHEIDFNTEAGLLAGADGGSVPLLGESVVGVAPFNWGESGLRARLRNNRMPPNSPFDVNELTRNGPMVTHPITGVQVRAVDLIGEWVIGKDGIAGTFDDALDN